MSWPEVSKVSKENRRELVLNGSKISERIQKDGLDKSIFTLTTLNYLNISETCLHNLDDEFANLLNLQTLLLHGNKLREVNPRVFELGKLKVLDLSNNDLEAVPEAIGNLGNLEILNVSMNSIESLPDLRRNKKLAVLDASNNERIRDFGVLCVPELGCLTQLKLNGNRIESIPREVRNLAGLKDLNLESNRIGKIPDELVSLNKLKDLNLKSNPIADRRLLKLIEQNQTKKIWNYLKQNSKIETSASEAKASGGSEPKPEKPKIVVKQFKEETGTKITFDDRVKAIRGYILCCVLTNLKFTPETVKRFIQLQTKLHEDFCGDRVKGTIATHDLGLIMNLRGDSDSKLVYTSEMPEDLRLIPLGQTEEVSAKALIEKLNSDPEKKRKTNSGISKYLHLLRKMTEFPCLKVGETIISFPPITNSDLTKISVATESILLEVTSDGSLKNCSEILDGCVAEFRRFFGSDPTTVEQVKIVDSDGKFKNVYPSRLDLNYEDVDVIRE